MSTFLCIEVSYDNNVVDSCPQPVASFTKLTVGITTSTVEYHMKDGVALETLLRVQ